MDLGTFLKVTGLGRAGADSHACAPMPPCLASHLAESLKPAWLSSMLTKDQHRQGGTPRAPMIQKWQGGDN